MAVKLEQPTTFATFVYTAYDYSQSRWQIKDRSTIRLQLDSGTQDRSGWLNSPIFGNLQIPGWIETNNIGCNSRRKGISPAGKRHVLRQ